MKLKIRKIWFRGKVEGVADALFEIPQFRELFDDWIDEGEMRPPRTARVYHQCWQAKPITDKLPSPGRDVYLVLTSLNLKGDDGLIHGRGFDRRALASNNAYMAGIKNDIFDPRDVDFNAVVFSEIGHALGSQHHDFDSQDPCLMSHNCHPEPKWTSLGEIRFCERCYETIKRSV